MKVLKQTREQNLPKGSSSAAYVYEIRVDGVVRYIGKGRNGRIYSHLIDAKRTAAKPGVKIRNLSPHFRKMLVGAVRRGSKIKEKVVADNLTEQQAYTIEHQALSNCSGGIEQLKNR